jgi:hypothetical protein
MYYTLVYSFCRKVSTLYVIDGELTFDQAIDKLDEIFLAYTKCACCGERWKSWRVNNPTEVVNMTHVLPASTVVYYSEIGRFVFARLVRKESEE